jgi:hypothetical protein
MNAFDRAQVAYDNALPPSYSDTSDVGRDDWESTLELTELLDNEVIEQLLWEQADQPYLRKKIDEAWIKHLEAQKEQADIERAEALAEAREWRH